ncbi:conserved hypothetical protein [Rhodospirillaceae bacterium LM-1]|nr:conserved hypothetical protein [Rhodospirillaceae bacterium LM-1]
MAGRESFEVQVLQGKRWTLQTVCETQTSATREAQAAIKAKREYEAVRVMRMWMRSDGLEGEKQVFFQEQEGGPITATIVNIDDAPWCASLDDVYGRESRRMLGRLLRKYLDTVFLTPSELLYNYRALRRIEEADTLLPSATEKVANLQVKAKGAPPDLDPRLRREELYRLVNQVMSRARQWSDDYRVPAFDGEDLEQLESKIKELSAQPDERQSMLMASLCLYLAQGRSWDAKLEKILDLLKPGLPEHLQDALDEILAEVLDGASVIQDLLGAQPGLGAALVAIVRLASGKMAGQGRPPPGLLGRLDTLFSKTVMPACRAVLYDRVKRQLATGRRLSPEGEDEAQAFAALVVALHDGTGGFPEGMQMLDALMDRAGRVYAEPDMPPEPKKTIDAMVRLIAEMRARIRFLTNLAVTSFGQKNLDVVVNRLGGAVLGLKGLEEVTYPRGNQAHRLGDGTQIQKEILESALPQPIKSKLCAKIDELLADYIRREGIVEKLDHASDPLKARAERLVQFCASGLLLEGKALSIARERTQTLLRQPDFVAKFVEGVPEPKEAERQLRQFHLLLAKAGFKQ